MPGSVAAASATGVFPWQLATAFTREITYEVQRNDYPGGESQRRNLVSNSRRAWILSQRLTPTQITDLWDFYVAHRGSHVPFYFYDVRETLPRWSYDLTGVAVTGRYLVRFDCTFQSEMELARHNVTVRLIEVY